MERAAKDLEVQDALCELEGHNPLVSFVMSTFGAVGEQASGLMTFVSQSLAERWMTPLQVLCLQANFRVHHEICVVVLVACSRQSSGATSA